MKIAVIMYKGCPNITWEHWNFKNTAALVSSASQWKQISCLYPVKPSVTPLVITESTHGWEPAQNELARENGHCSAIGERWCAKGPAKHIFLTAVQTKVQSKQLSSIPPRQAFEHAPAQHLVKKNFLEKATAVIYSTWTHSFPSLLYSLYY